MGKEGGDDTGEMEVQGRNMGDIWWDVGGRGGCKKGGCAYRSE